MARVEYNSNKDKNDIENREKEAQIALLEINNELKSEMFYFVKRFLIVYSIVSCVLVIIHGVCKTFLSEPVIITIITTNFIEILALPKLICRHLFPTNKD